MNCQKCHSEAVWVDNGLRLQWWYCRDCKIEVVPVKAPPEALFDPKADQSVHMWNQKTQQYDDACFFCTVPVGESHKKDCNRPKVKKWSPYTSYVYGFDVGPYLPWFAPSGPPDEPYD